MHFEVLIEDQSGKTTMEILLPKIIGENHTFRIIAYKGIGRIPKDIGKNENPGHRILLNSLPRLLKGYGQTFKGYGAENKALLVVICDLDNKRLTEFKNELLSLLESCSPKPETLFIFAIEEGEAWFLGDTEAVKKAYPNAKEQVLKTYVNDSICGTWEKLADAIYNGGAKALEKKGFHAIGEEKSKWARKITPLMNLNKNNSPSFCYFLDKLIRIKN
ncbi:MAG: DUF4276 family protein [Firmicutes bacterium]|nr:DUF4276 family protein [Bacillota bacterium]